MKKIYLMLFALCTVSLSFGQTAVVTENFDGCAMPANWTANIIGGDDNWQFGDNTGSNIDGTCMVYFDDDALSGSANASSIELISDSWDLTAYATATIDFDYNVQIASSETFKVEVYDGAQWVEVLAVTSTDCGAWGCTYPRASIDVTAYINNAFAVRFLYDDAAQWGYWVGIDNFAIMTPMPDDVKSDSLVVASGCGLTNAEQVTMKITNLGSNDAMDIPVAYDVDGGGLVNEVANITLTPGASANYTFTATVDLSTPAVYNLRAWTELAGDSDNANDTTAATAQSVPTVASFPYSEGFESGPGGWSMGGTASSWAIGAPAGGVINAAANGTNAAVTNLTGSYNTYEDSWLTSPCLDFSGLSADPELHFSLWYETEACCDEMYVESSIDGGTTWQRVGTMGTGDNWYNVAENEFNGSSAGWLNSKNVLVGLAGQANVLIRFFLHSDSSQELDGIGIDDIVIQLPASFDAATADVNISKITCGYSGADTVSVTVSNEGADDITNFNVVYQLNGGILVTQPVPGTITPGTSVVVEFATLIDLSAAMPYELKVWTDLSTDALNNNDTTTVNPVQQLTINTFPYFNDFETDEGGWIAGGANSSWQFGVVAGAVITTASSGANAWMTNLTGSYNNDEVSYIESPCIDLSSFAADPILRFAINYDTEGCCDQGWVEVSTDFGVTWTKLGAAGEGTNWYNDGANNEWNGNSGGWLPAKHILDGLAGESGVKIRFAFSSDGSVINDGMAIDDFRIEAPPADEAAATMVNVTRDACEYSGADTVIVNFHNYGSATITSISANYEVDGGAVTNEMFVVNVAAGEDGSVAFTTLVDFSAIATYNVKAWIDLTNDADVTNDTTWASFTQTSIINTFPYMEDFETATQLTQMTDEQFNWTLLSGSTPSSDTGPTADHTTGSGSFMYTEASDQVANDVAVLQSNCIDISSLQLPALEFWYHMWGADMGSLDVEIFANGMWTNVFTLTGDQSDQWSFASINLTPYLSSGTIRYRFVGTIGPSFTSDVSLDDIVVLDKPPFVDVEMANVIAPDPSNPCIAGTANENVTIELVNNGIDIDEFTVHYQVNGGIMVTETVAGGMTSGQTLNHTFNTTTDLTAAGSYDFVVWLTSATDTVEVNDTIAFTLTVSTLLDVDLGGNTSICTGNSTTLDAGSATSWLWSTGETSQTINVNAAGDYAVSVTNADGCVSTDAVNVEVITTLVIDLGDDVVACDGQTVTLDAGVAGADSYLWSNAEATQTIDVTASGTYYVDVNKCGTASDTVIVTFDPCLSVDELNAQNALSVYPNPNGGQFNITVKDVNAGTGTLQIVSISGQLVLQSQLNIANRTATQSVDLTDLGAGIYFVKYNNGTTQLTEKLIVR